MPLSERDIDFVDDIDGWTTRVRACTFPGHDIMSSTLLCPQMRRVDIHYCPV